MIFIDETTRQRIITAKHAGDIVYDAKSDTGTVITQEDVVVIGQWNDWTGSGGVNTRSQLMAVTTNQFAGTEAGMGGAKLGNLNERGINPDNKRIRTRRIYKRLDGRQD